VKFSDVSRANSVPIFRVCWWFGRTKTDESLVLVLTNHQHNLMMGTKLAPETSENLNRLTRLTSRETFIKFCRPESSKIYVFNLVCDINGRTQADLVGELKLKKLSGPKREEVTRGWRRINKEHVHGFCTPHLILYG